MTYVTPKAATRRIKPAFKTIASYDRFKRLQLGLTVQILKDKIPWGYVKDSVNPAFVNPDITALRLLKKAKEYIKTCSLREVAQWLSVETGHKISGEGLRCLIQNRYPFNEIFLSDDERERLYKNPTDFQTYTLKDEDEGETQDDN